MKRSIRLFIGISTTLLYVSTALSVNPCIDYGPYVRFWQCYSPGIYTSGQTVTNPLDYTSKNVCVGQTIIQPVLVFEPTFSPGQIQRQITYSCPENQPQSELALVEYSSGPLYFDDPIPEAIFTPGTYTYTAKVDAWLSPLVGWWRAEGDGNNRASMAHAATLHNGATYASGKVGQGFSFDGIDDFISISNTRTDFISAHPGLNFGLGNNFSIECWMKVAGNAPFVPIVDKTGLLGGTLRGYRLELINGTLRFSLFSTDGASSYSTTLNIQDNTFHHVAVTANRYSSSGLKIYVDGNAILTGDATPASGDLSNNSDIWLGARNGLSFHFQGLIDELSIYYCAISTAEVQAIYNAGINGKCQDVTAGVCAAQPRGCICPTIVGQSLATVTINVNAAPSAPTAGNNGPIQAGQTLNLTASTVPGTGVVYSWSGPNGFVSSQQNPSIPNATAANSGSYTVTATLNGCTSTAAETTVEVIGPPKLNQTITFNAIPNKTYGNAPFTLSATASSGLPITFSVVSGPATLAGTTITLTGAGTVTVRASQQGDSTYNAATSVDQSFVIAKATLTVTAGDKSKTYGAANPTLTVAYSGFVNGENASALSGAPSLSTTATTTSIVGTYPITTSVGTLSAANYSFAFVNGILTVTKAVLNIGTDGKSKIYGAANPTLTWTPTGFVNGDNASVLTGTPSLSTTATTTSIVGTYPITISVGTLSAANYSFTFANGTLTVTKAVLNIAADNKLKVYGAANPTLTWSPTGFVNGDTASVLSGAPSLNIVATTTSAIGSYSISISVGTLSAANYSFAYANGVLSITPASLMVTADPKTKATGAAVPPLTGNITGIQAGDNITATYSTTANTGSPAGTYPIIPALVDPSGRSTNYTVTLNNGTLTILDPPALTSQPVTTITDRNTTAVFTVVATGATPLSYQWRKNGTNLSNGINVSGATTATLTLSAVTLVDSADYSVLVQNSVGMATSTNATLWVFDPAGVYTSITNAVEGGGYGEFTFYLPQPAATNNTPVQFFLGGNAELDYDFTLTTPTGVPASNTVYFAAGTTLSRLRVNATNDSVQSKRPRSVTAIVTNCPAGILDNQIAVIDLIDNDPPLVSVRAAVPNAAEPKAGVPSNGTFRFSREGSNTTSLVVTFTLTGSATNGADYDLLATSVTFPAGSNFVDIILAPRTTTVGIYNGPRQAVATIPNSGSYSIGANGATIFISEEDLPAVQVVATDADARETGPKSGTFSFYRSGYTGLSLPIQFAVSGTATNGADYVTLTNSITIPAGTNRLDISVTPLADALSELSETVVITLKGSLDYSIGTTNSATVFIDDSHATTFDWTLIKQASAYHTTPILMDSPAMIEIYRYGSARSATNIPYQIYSNSLPYNISYSYMRVYGNVTNNQVRFEANSNIARVFLTAAIPGNTDNNAGGYFGISNLFMASTYPVHFLSADRYVKISIITTNAIKGTATTAKLRATRYAVGAALSIPFSTNNPPLSTNGGTALGGEYTLSNSGFINLAGNATTGDLDITGTTTYLLGSWSSLVLSVPLNDSTIAYDVPGRFLTFLRDNVTNTGDLSEPDTDRDGLSDLWELTYGLDPLTENDPNADPDKEGLSILEENNLRTNPNNPDSDGNGTNDFKQANTQIIPGADYLPIRLRMLDTGKINNGNNCAACHTAVMRAGDFRFFAPKHGQAAEKIFYFKKGTNYPVSLTELFQNLPRPNNTSGNPTTTEAYSAELLVSQTSLPVQFFITDAQSRLGAGKVWTTTFPTPSQNPVATLIVPRIDVTFTNVSGNTPLTVNSNWNGGMRVFPDRLSPTDGTPRNVVRVRVTTTPAMPGKVVRLKSFDVDDPTIADLDQGIIDTNDSTGIARGNDNRGTPPAGTLAQMSVTLDSSGVGETQMTVPMQPGDNLRVAALFYGTDAPSQTAAQAHLDSLQVTDSSAALYVTNSDDQVTGFLGSVSSMLTVWRRLHIEVDSMDAVDVSGIEANSEIGTVASYVANSPVAGQSRINLSVDLRGWSKAYENGTIEISGIGTFNVISNKAIWLLGDDVFISGTPGIGVVGRTFIIYDDDDRFLSTIGLPPALPKDGESANIIEKMRNVFFPAYIDVTNANAMNLNTRKRIPFKRNVWLHSGDIYGDIFHDAKDVYDTQGFWAHTLVFGYQPATWEDRDDNDEDGDSGVSPEPTALYQAGISVVWIELIREASIDRKDTSLTQEYLNYRKDYTNWISGIAAHEIGHSPGRQNAKLDHNEDGLMDKNGQAITPFWPKTIGRFRNAASWSD